MTTTAPKPRDAATVLLLRDAGGGGVETYMIQRHGKSGFMAGAFVFPGGKVDPADADAGIARRATGRTISEAAEALAEADDPRRALSLFVAAARETFEEAGVLLADTVDPTLLGAARERLQGGESFATVLAHLDAMLRLDQLVPHSRWITPEAEPRRYDTRFFVARAPEGQRASLDGREATDGRWLSPARALDQQRQGSIQLPPPTVCTLELLASHRDVDHVLSATRGRPPPLVRPVIRELEGRLAICLPGDPSHPERERVLEGATRLYLARGRWWARGAED